MQDTKNLKRKIKEYTAKIAELKLRGASLSEVNYWRRELNRLHERIRERDTNSKRNEKLYRKAT